MFHIMFTMCNNYFPAELKKFKKKHSLHSFNIVLMAPVG